MQRSVTAYFHTRKRQATDDLCNKAKVLLLEQDQTRLSSPGARPAINTSTVSSTEHANMVIVTKQSSGKKSADSPAMKSTSVVRNIQFDSPKVNTYKSPRMNTRARTLLSRNLFNQEDQTDIRSSLIKTDNTEKKVIFEKKGTLSPRKAVSSPKKEPNAPKEIQLSAGCTTPKKSAIEKLTKQELTLDDIKHRINKSSRLAELKACIARFKQNDQKLSQLQEESNAIKPHIRKFDNIQLEIPVSPQKGSPRKLFSPSKNKEAAEAVSPQRRILFEPKETTPSPIKGSPTKTPAYQRHLSLTESGTTTLPLPYNYRFLAEVFRCMDTVSVMLFNRKELITFKKLKPAVQELLRRNFTLEHLAQIKSIYPDAYEYRQEKHHAFGSLDKQDKYELVLTPIISTNLIKKESEKSSDNNEESTSSSTMSPAVLLERRRKFYNTLLERVKDEHEKFLLSLDAPMKIPKEKIMRWHPEFDVNSCKDIEKADLPQPPTVERASSAKNILEKAVSLYNCPALGKSFEKGIAQSTALENKSAALEDKSTSTVTKSETVENEVPKVEVSVVDTPPATPTTQSSYLTTAFKGIPKALLEKVRAKQAAKALEAMTRTPNASKEATEYSRLPELSKILRNIFVAEKKGVLSLEFVISQLDNSYRTKLTPNELEKHVRLLCKLLPTWASIHNVRKVDYLKLARNVDMNKVVKRLQLMANDKVTASCETSNK